MVTGAGREQNSQDCGRQGKAGSGSHGARRPPDLGLEKRRAGLDAKGRVWPLSPGNREPSKGVEPESCAFRSPSREMPLTTGRRVAGGEFLVQG